LWPAGATAAANRLSASTAPLGAFGVLERADRHVVARLLVVRDVADARPVGRVDPKPIMRAVDGDHREAARERRGTARVLTTFPRNLFSQTQPQARPAFVARRRRDWRVSDKWCSGSVNPQGEGILAPKAFGKSNRTRALVRRGMHLRPHRDAHDKVWPRSCCRLSLIGRPREK
jgi:hypothetical protein